MRELNNTMSNEGLVVIAQAGDMRAKNELIERNMKIVNSIAYKYKNNPNFEFEELVQIVLIGFSKAINNYKAGSKAKFSTYAYNIGMNELKMELRDNRLIHFYRKDINDYYKVVNLKRKTNDLEIIAADSGLSIKRVKELFWMFSENAKTSINIPVNSGGSSKDGSEVFLSDYLKSCDNVEKEVIDKYNLHSDYVESLLCKLDKQSRYVIEMQFFENKTQKNLSKELNTTQTNISRIVRKSLNIMQKKNKCDIII